MNADHITRFKPCRLHRRHRLHKTGLTLCRSGLRSATSRSRRTNQRRRMAEGGGHMKGRGYDDRERKQPIEMLKNFQTRILKTISSGGRDGSIGCAYEGKSKLAALMGDEFFGTIAGKVVLDFGCGEGAEAIEWLREAPAR